MGVRITTRDQRIFNEFKNGYSFSNNPLDTTSNLAGSVMENLRAYKLLQVEWFSKSEDTSSSWIVNTSTGSIESNSGNFVTDGFAVDDTFIYEELSSGSGANFTGKITSISPKLILFTLLTGSRINTDTIAIIRGTTDLSASIFKFGLIGNNENFNIESKVSGNDQAYYAGAIGARPGGPGTPRDTTFVSMSRLGQFRGWQTGGMSIRFVLDNYNSATARTGYQLFEIYHNYTIVPYYLDGQLSDLQNNIIPPLLNGLNSLKYVYSPGFRTVLSNPNTEKTVVEDTNLGSVAWYNENFNGFNNKYSVKSIAYQDANSLTNADGLLVAGKTRVTCFVENTLGTYTGGERFGIYVSYLPEQIEYQNTILTDLKDNFLYDRVVQSEGQAPVVGGDFITNAFATVVAGELKIEFDVEYNAAQKIRLSNKIAQAPIYFLIGIQAGDITVSSGNSDRVIMLADVKEYDESPDIEGLMDITKFDIYAHDKQILSVPGTTNITSWNEDGLVLDFDFDLDLNFNAFINTLDFKLIAENPTTGNVFELDSYTYNISGSVVSAGVQQLNVTTDRGYILDNGDQFNDVTLIVGANAAGIQTYSGRFAQKISWQDWIENLDVDTIFYDPSKPFDNFNNKSSNYSALNGYEIKLAVSSNLFGTNSFGTSGITDYLFLSPALTIFDYEKDGNLIPIWSGVIETFNPSNLANLSGAILTGQDTLFRCTWTNSQGPLSTAAGLWGENRMEETGDIGYQITEMSSINNPASNQILKPKTGFSLLDIQVVSGNIVMECLIDGSVAQSGINYNLSSRIHGVATIIDGKLTSPLGELKDTSGTVETKVEAP